MAPEEPKAAVRTQVRPFLSRCESTELRFSATTRDVQALCGTVGVYKAPANGAVSSSTSISMFGRTPAARGTSRFSGAKGSKKTQGPRLKQEPLRTGRTRSSRAPPRGRRLPPFPSSSPGRSSQSRKTALRPCLCMPKLKTDVNINNNGNNTAAKRQKMWVQKSSGQRSPWAF